MTLPAGADGKTRSCWKRRSRRRRASSRTRQGSRCSTRSTTSSVTSRASLRLCPDFLSKLTCATRQARRSPLRRVRVSDHGQQHARRTAAVAAGADAARDPRVALWQEREPEVLLLSAGSSPLCLFFFLSVFVPPCVSRRVSLCNSFYFPDAMDPGRKGGRSSRIFGSASKQAGDGVPLLLSGGEREKKVSECSFLRSL